jgi:hypothetical protein
LKTLKSDGRVNNGGRRRGAGKPKGRKSALTLEREAARARVLAAAGLREEHVMGEVVHCAFPDIRTFFDAQNNLKPVSEWTAAQGAQVVSMEVIKKNAEAGDGKIDVIHKLKLGDKAKHLEMLMKHYGKLVEKLFVSGALTIIHELPE